VRLASKLTGWRLDVKNENKYNEAMKKSYDALASLPGVTQKTAEMLYEMGLESIEELAKTSIKDLNQVAGIQEEEAISILEAAEQFLNNAHRQKPGDQDTESSDRTDTETDFETLKEINEEESEDVAQDSVPEPKTASGQKYPGTNKDTPVNDAGEKQKKIGDNEL
jgi:N utilization substance protein A